MKQITTLLVLLLTAAAICEEPTPPKPMSLKKAFLNPEIFQIKVLEDSSSWKRSKGGSTKRKSKDTDYSLKLRNNGLVELPALRIEYCIYRDRQICDLPFVKIDTRLKTIPALRPKRSEKVDVYGGISFKVENGGFLNEIVGGCFRISLTTSDGEKLTREIQYPENFSTETYPWKDYENPKNLITNPLENKAIFNNPALFNISIQKTDTPWEDDDKEVRNRESRETIFLINLGNQSEVKLTGIRVEHCLYSNRLNSEGEYISTDSYKPKVVGSISPFHNEKVISGYCTNFKVPGTFLNEVFGTRSRVYLPLKNGTEVMREVCLPANLSDEDCPWEDYVEK